MRTLLLCLAMAMIPLSPAHAAGAGPVAAPSDVAPAMRAAMLTARAKDQMRANPEEALALAQKAEGLLAGDPRTDVEAVAEALWLEGEALLRLNRAELASPKIERGLHLLSTVQRSTRLQGELLLSRGGVATTKANVAQALADYQTAHNIFRSLGETRKQAIALQQIASLYRQAGDLKMAMRYDAESSEIYRGDPGLDLSNLNNRGNALRVLGDLQQAETEYRRALVVARGIGSKVYEISILRNIAGVQIDARRFDAAARTIRRAALLETDADPVRSPLVALSARLALDEGNHLRAASLIAKYFAGVDLATTELADRDAHETAYKVYQHSAGAANLALRHLEALKRLDDKTASLAASANTALLAARFDYANQNLKIANLKADEARRKFEFEQARGRMMQLIFTGVAAVTLVGVGALIFGLLTIRRSRNEVRAANIGLEATNTALEKALAAKTEFLATTSHEIRTPLNGILGMTQVMLADRALDATLRDRLSVVHGAGNTMKALVDDILDVAKMETGNLTIEKAPVDLPTTLHEVSRLWEAQARTKGVDFVLDLAECPALIEGDAARLRQIIFNLLSNALKFTESGAVTLRGTLAADGRVAISISDTGIGIPADKLDVIFESFRQVDAGTTRKYGGTGLGLSICRNLARAMGGDVGVTSATGRGSTFTVWLPFVRPAQADDAQCAAPASCGALIVDRNPIVRSMLRALLEPHFETVSLANGLEEAGAMIAASRPRMVLLDEAVAREAAEPVVAIAALVDAARDAGASVKLLWTGASADERDAFARIGVADVIGKPIAGQALVARLAASADGAAFRSLPALVSRAA